MTDDAGGDVGAIQCWHLALSTTEPVQPPTDMTITNMVGNTVTFRWTPSPAGDQPTGYVFEGGVTPGQVLASIPSGVPSLTLGVPTGSFFVRVKAVSGSTTSGASNELPILRRRAGRPLRPEQLAADTQQPQPRADLAQHLRRRADVAVPDVTGAITATLPLPLVEGFTDSGVPDGAYNFSVRAANAAGGSPASNIRGATFAAANGCTGAPAVPANFRAFKSGQTIFVDWDPPGIGGAVSFYVLNVTGNLAATIPTSVRALSGAVPAGAYNLSLAAVNQCGVEHRDPDDCHQHPLRRTRRRGSPASRQPSRSRLARGRDAAYWDVVTLPPTSTFSSVDLDQLAARGITIADAEAQLALLRTPPAPIVLDCPCTVGDGITRIDPDDGQPALLALGDEAAASGRVTKLVPASGAASRMFKELIAAQQSTERPSNGEAARTLFTRLDAFPFAHGLLRAVSGIAGTPASDAEERAVLRALLDELGYARLPKGLIPFHHGTPPRTAFEEHLFDAAWYTRQADGTCRLHFTVAGDCRDAFQHALDAAAPLVAARHPGTRLAVTFSEQVPATDTLAGDRDGGPFRTADGALLFLLGGHGARLATWRRWAVTSSS